MSEDIILKSILCLLVVVLITTIAFFVKERLKNENLKSYQIGLLIFATSAISAIITGVLRAMTTIQVSTLSGFLIYLLLTNFLLKRYADRVKAKTIVGLVTVGLLCIDLPFRLENFDVTLISLPLFLIVMLGIFAGYFFNNRKKLSGKLNLSLSLVMVVLMFSYGIPKWVNKLNFGNFSGDVYEKDVKISASIVSQKNELVEIKKGKYNVLDFWFIGCGVCVEEFPHFQRSYHAYRNNPNVQFYAVNIPMGKADQVDPFDFLLKRNFNFPMVTNRNSQLIRDFNISVYPTVVILNKDGDMVYKGNIAGADIKLKSLL